MMSGSTRHILQIAKLHPCICSWDELKELQRELSYAASRKIDRREFSSEEETKPYLDKKFIKYYSFDEDYSYFQQVDNTNILQTSDILNIMWPIAEIINIPQP